MLQKINAEIGNVTLVAVSKYQPDAAVMQLYEQGQRVFGESRAQDLEKRAQTFPQDINWHFIGHLQTNKIKQVVPYASLIHSVDSEKLLFELEKYGEKNDVQIPILLQVHIATDEPQKFGFSTQEIDDLLTYFQNQPLQYVQIQGLMGMASNTDDATIIDTEFAALHLFFKMTKTKFQLGGQFQTLSMGMSSDYKIALKNGSTMLRIGSLLF